MHEHSMEIVSGLIREARELFGSAECRAGAATSGCVPPRAIPTRPQSGADRPGLRPLLFAMDGHAMQPTLSTVARDMPPWKPEGGRWKW